ncbi:MAG: hypothetical protein P8I56_04995 [Paracoccaceae bacterium]|nr:hypothetical protein [Paracoccaceae bacterium]
MTLHLHIGAHKTATTHLQATLIKHREQLTEAGVQYERPDHIRSLIGSGRRAAAQSRIVPSVRAGLAGQRLARIDAGKDRLVLSDENSLGQCIEIFDRERLYPTVRHRMKIWRRLAAQRDTTIYLSIRNYADFFSGAYVQSIRKAAIYRPDADSLAALARMPRRWPDVIADIRHALPDVRAKIWAYEDYEALSPRLLLETTGMVLKPVQRRPMATPSIKTVSAFQAASKPAEQTLDQIAQIHPISEQNPKFSLWSATQTDELSAMYRDDVTRLRNDLGEDFLRP